MYDLALRPLSPKIRALALVGLMLPGTFAILARSRPGGDYTPIFNVSQEREICSALRDIAPEEPVATAQIHPNPVLICGHRVVAPFPSFYWAFGRNGSFFEDNLKALMNGQSSWREIARTLNTRYIFWGPEEKKAFANSTHPWTDGTSKLLARGAWGEIYDIGN